MSALIGDVLSGDISPGVCNAAVNAGGKLLKIVDMTYRYGKPEPDGRRTLSLTDVPPIEVADPRAERIARLEQELSDLRAIPGR